MPTTATAAAETDLGGRLPLLAPAALNADQQKLYDALLSGRIAGAEKSGFEAETADGRLIGPFNAMLYSPLVGQGQLAFKQAEAQHTSLSQRVRQVVILTTGAVWQAAYELYAHAIAGHKAGLSAAAIQALAAGQAAPDLNDDERLAHEFTQQLVAARHIGPDLYQRAVAAFGEPGVVNMVYLAGAYMLTSALLNTFAVPVPPAPAPA